jgi:hypothetical protein
MLRRFVLQRRRDHPLDLLISDLARRPGRGSSVNPSNRSRTNRDRHLRTVSRDTARLAATSVFDRPFAHSNTIRDRNANACAVVHRRVQPART